MYRRCLATFIWLVTLAILLIPSPVGACSPTETPDDFLGYDTAAYRAQAVPVVLEGIIVATFKTQNIYLDDTATVEVRQYLKGNGPAMVTISGFGGGSDCLPIAYRGTHAIFYVLGNPNVELRISNTHPFSTLALDSPDPATMAEISSSVGQAPVVLGQKDETWSIIRWLAVVTVLGVVIIVGYRAIKIRKRQGH